MTKYKLIKTRKMYELKKGENSPNGYPCMWRNENDWFNLDLSEINEKFQKVEICEEMKLI